MTIATDDASTNIWKDIAWFPVMLATVAGGPSVLALMQTVFVEYRLSGAFQWVVDSYATILSVIGGVFEPLALPVAQFLRAIFGVDLALQPHFRIAIAVIGILSIALVRTEVSFLKESRNKRSTVANILAALLGTFLGGLFVGFIPLNNALNHGLAAGLPLFILFSMLALATKIRNPLTMIWQRHSGLANGAAYGALAFVLAVALYQIEPLATGSAMVAMSLIVLAVGIERVAVGFGLGGYGLSYPTPRSASGNRRFPRIATFGLTIIGGFLCAAIIALGDFALR